MARRKMTKKQRAAALRNLKKARAALKRGARPARRRVARKGPSRRRVQLRAASALRRTAKKRVGKRYGSITVDRFIVPIGMSKKASRKGRKAIAGVPWSGKKGTVRYYGTRRSLGSGAAGLLAKNESVTWTNPFAVGPVRAYKGRKHRGTVFKAKRRHRMVTKAGARRVSRAWRYNPDDAPVTTPTTAPVVSNPRGRAGVAKRRAASKRLTRRHGKGSRVVVFPGGRVAVFHKPGTAAFRKGRAKKRMVGKRLAKLYGFRKSRRSRR
jgi:hypothetical protein